MRIVALVQLSFRSNIKIDRSHRLQSSLLSLSGLPDFLLRPCCCKFKKHHKRRAHKEGFFIRVKEHEKGGETSLWVKEQQKRRERQRDGEETETGKEVEREKEKGRKGEREGKGERGSGQGPPLMCIGGALNGCS